ncbi:MAG: hypothetical protein WCI18_17095, partial [Pseudomonadota bacterium]
SAQGSHFWQLDLDKTAVELSAKLVLPAESSLALVRPVLEKRCVKNLSRLLSKRFLQPFLFER